MTLVFFVLLVLYFSFQKKIEYWQTSCALGFKSKAPANFLQNPSTYSRISTALFVGSIITALLSENLSGFISVPLIAAAYLFTGILGRNRAYDHYRADMADLIGPESSDEENARLLAESQKSNEELEKDVEGVMTRV